MKSQIKMNPNQCRKNQPISTRGTNKTHLEHLNLELEKAHGFRSLACYLVLQDQYQPS